MVENDVEKVEKIISLCKRRGIIFPNSEIYGTFAGFFDYGNYGSELKRNVESSWWKHFVNERGDMVGIDGSIITHPDVWKASGHLESFNDPLVECKKCKKKFRADHLVETELKISVDGLSEKHLEELIEKHKIKCPECKGELKFIQPFNLMFKTSVGAETGTGTVAYLRPETAQVIFTNFKIVQQAARKKLPFGIAQIGKAFRNEISPRNFVFRAREFDQMEIEYFIHPKKMDSCEFLTNEHLKYELNVLTAEAQSKDKSHQKMKIKYLLNEKIMKTPWHAFWIVECMKWFEKIGIKKENLRIREHTKNELSHYSSETWDIEYNFPWGWKELEGIANRTDFDLKQHMKFTKSDLNYFDEETKEKVVPFVIEPSFGLDRTIMVLLLDAYREEKDEKTKEIKVKLKLHPEISPVTVAIFPLMKKDGLAEKAREVFEMLKTEFVCEYDEAGSIGKRYARADEVGTPWAVTIDYDTLRGKTVTLRNRDTTEQIRVKISELEKSITKLMNNEAKLKDLGKII